MSETLLLHPHAYSKLRWRCRRGLLENALFITNYFEAHASSMTQADAQALDALMALPAFDAAQPSRQPDAARAAG